MRLFHMLTRPHALQWLCQRPDDQELLSAFDSKFPSTIADGILKGLLDRHSRRC